MMAKLSAPSGRPSTQKVHECVMNWESEIQRYEDQSGEKFPGPSKIGGILQICPAEVATHVRLNGS